MKYKIGELEVEAIQWKGQEFDDLFVNKCRKLKGTLNFNFGDYLIMTDSSTFILSEQDFNKIATKVKEPKFKVGDKVYWLSEDCEGLSLDKKEVKEIIHDQDFGFVYDLDALSLIKEKYLLTLEEAIGKLKEL